MAKNKQIIPHPVPDAGSPTYDIRLMGFFPWLFVYGGRVGFGECGVSGMLFLLGVLNHGFHGFSLITRIRLMEF